jgi:hypothetical protein
MPIRIAGVAPAATALPGMPILAPLPACAADKAPIPGFAGIDRLLAKCLPKG